MHAVFGGSGVYEWICLFIDVCVCLTAVVLSGLFANMLVHEWRQACREAQSTEMQGEGEACSGRLRHMGPPQKAN